MKEKILIVAAHPDDEVLGCGGYISKYSKTKEFKIIFIGEGTSCRYEKRNNRQKINKEIVQREKQSIKALNYLGVKKYKFYNMPCGRFDKIDIIDINKIIEKEIQYFKPNVIITHNSEDCNNDHRIVNRSAMMASRPSIKNYFLKTILNFEILSSSEWNFENQFVPNHFELLEERHLKKKIKSFYFYKSEIQKSEMPRNKVGIKILARYRGKIVRSKYAEAFKIIRSFS